MIAFERHLAAGSTIDTIGRLVDKANALVRKVARPPLVQFLLRVALATPFWRSGILKWDGFLRINDIAISLFADEFMLHLPGGPYSFPAPAAMAFLSASAEIMLPILLILGLATRFTALGLLVMTAIIQLTVPDGWPVHIAWVAMAFAIMAGGAGWFSADHWLSKLHRRLFGARRD